MYEVIGIVSGLLKMQLLLQRLDIFGAGTAYPIALKPRFPISSFS